MFLELNGIGITAAANDVVYDLVMDVASRTTGVDDLAARLLQLLPPSAD